jgi:hypothetical protein
MEILGFNRVELIVAPEEIEQAVTQFNEMLGLRLPAPHRVSNAAVLSATDFDGGIEFVAPLDDAPGFGSRLAQHGSGQIGPLVWEVADIEAAREWVVERGYRITYEYDSSKGTDAEQAAAVYQLVLDRDQWFGFTVTLMQRRSRS